MNGLLTVLTIMYVVCIVCDLYVVNSVNLTLYMTINFIETTHTVRFVLLSNECFITTINLVSLEYCEEKLILFHISTAIFCAIVFMFAHFVFNV